MISWTIPAAAILTGQTSKTQTVSASASASTSQVAPGSEYYSSSSSSTASSSYSTFAGEWGTTTYYSSSSSSTYLRTSSVTYSVDPNNTTDPGFSSSGITTGSASSSQSSSASSAPTSISATSTTQTYESGFLTTGSFIALVNTRIWTTTREDSEATTLEFYDQEFETETTAYGERASVRTATRDTTTTIAATVTAPAAATVYQANTSNEAAEVLYHISAPAVAWTRYLVASAEAQSGTRFTVSPVLETVSEAFFNKSDTATLSFSNASATQSLSWRRSTTTASTLTTVNAGNLPHVTGTRTTSGLTTQSTTVSFVLFSSNAATISNLTATTFAVTSYATSAKTISLQSGNSSFEATIATTASTAKTVTLSAQTTVASSGQTTNSSVTLSSGETLSIAKNRSVFPAAQVALDALRRDTSRSNYCTTGFIAGSQSGGWLTANGATLPFVSYAKNGSGRNGSVVFPATIYTLSSNSITFNTTTEVSGEEAATTASLQFGVSGATSTTIDQATGMFYPPNTHFGGEPGVGCTFVEVAPVGAYKDCIGGATTAFNGNATVLAHGQSAPLKFWRWVRQIGPLENRTNKNAIVWSVRRNQESPQFPVF